MEIDDEHREYHKRIIYVLFVMLIVLSGGVVFYHYKEKWSFIDALYFSAATMTTVGYGDITPQTNTGKLFTVFYVFMSVSIALYGLSLIASHFVEIREEFWLQRLGKLKGSIKMEHPKTLFEKAKGIFNYESEKLVNEYDKSVRNESRKKQKYSGGHK